MRKVSCRRAASTTRWRWLWKTWPLRRMPGRAVRLQGVARGACAAVSTETGSAAALAVLRCCRAGRAARQVAERDATLGQVVGRHLERDVVARDDADVELAHLAARIGDEVVSVVQRHAVAAVRQHF